MTVQSDSLSFLGRGVGSMDMGSVRGLLQGHGPSAGWSEYLTWMSSLDSQTLSWLDICSHPILTLETRGPESRRPWLATLPLEMAVSSFGK